MTQWFQGYAVNTVDAKGRLSVPADFRAVIEARSQNKVVVLAPHDREPCLVGYDAARMDRIMEEVEVRFASDFGPAREDYLRTVFGMSEQLAYDETGRIVLSATARALGEIGSRAFFHGMGDYFELWNPDLLLEKKGASSAIARVVKTALAAKGPRQ